jgi:hypothetical protein
MCVYSLDNENEGHCKRMWRTLAHRARTVPSRHLETRRQITTDGSYHSDRTGFFLTTTVRPAGIGNDDQRTQGQLRLAGTTFSSLVLQASLDVSVPPGPFSPLPLSHKYLPCAWSWLGLGLETAPPQLQLARLVPAQPSQAPSIDPLYADHPAERVAGAACDNGGGAHIHTQTTGGGCVYVARQVTSLLGAPSFFAVASTRIQIALHWNTGDGDVTASLWSQTTSGVRASAKCTATGTVAQ